MAASTDAIALKLSDMTSEMETRIGARVTEIYPAIANDMSRSGTSPQVSIQPSSSLPDAEADHQFSCFIKSRVLDLFRLGCSEISLLKSSKIDMARKLMSWDKSDWPD